MKRTLRIWIAFALLVAMLTASGCGKADQEKTNPTTDPNLEVLEYTLVAADAAALEQLEVYTNLQTLDLRGSDCYEAIESYIASHPQVKVTYDVEVAGTRYAPDVEILKLEDGSYELEELLSVMKHLPKLAGLELPMTSLTADQVKMITDSYPNLDVNYTIELMGEVVTSDLTELDLSGLTSEDLDENLLEKLRMLPGLTQVQLMDNSGNTAFTPTDVKVLMDAMPNAAMNYSFQLYGKTVTTADERVEFKNIKIGNDGIPEIRAALDILPSCTYFLMDNCGVDNEVMAQLRDDYPNTKVVWRVFWRNKYHVLTDTEMINSNGVRAKDIEVLKYCTDVMYLDIGHSKNLENIEVVRHMPKLKILIIMEAQVTDLSPLENCPDLEILELVECKKITDISVLANCTKLRGLNTSAATGIKDITPLFGLQNMERLYLGINSISDEMYEDACEALPNCWVTNSAGYSSGVGHNFAIGWRLDRGGRMSQFYMDMREIFGYKTYYYSGKEERISQI